MSCNIEDLTKDIAKQFDVTTEIASSMIERKLGELNDKIYQEVKQDKVKQLVGRTMELVDHNGKFKAIKINRSKLNGNNVELSYEDGSVIVDMDTGMDSNGNSISDWRKVSRRITIEGYNDSVAKVNKYVSDMLVMGGEYAVKNSEPLLKKFNDKLGEKFQPYKAMIHAIRTGIDNSDTLKSLKAPLGLVSDMTQKKLMKLMHKTTDGMKRNQQLRETAMIELENRITKILKAHSINSDTGHKMIDDVFGKSGFGNLVNNPKILNKLHAMVKAGNVDIQQLVNEAENGLNANDRTRAKELSEYFIEGKVGANSLRNSMNNHVMALATLYAMNNTEATSILNMLSSHPKLYRELCELSVTLKASNQEVIDIDDKMSDDYDGNYIHKVYKHQYAIRTVSLDEYNKNIEYTIDKSIWKVLQEPTKDTIGIVYSIKSTNTVDGLGTTIDRNRSGIAVSEDTLSHYSSSKNNIILTDSGARLILTREQEELLKPKHNFAHTYYRTYASQRDLVETENARKYIVDSMTMVLKTLGAAERLVKRSPNDMPEFLATELQLSDELKKHYVKVTNATSFNGFNKKVNYVRKDLKDVIMGYTHNSMISKTWPTAHKIEQWYLQLLQMAKIKMVMANPAKILNDGISNTVLLTSMDVGLWSMKTYGSKLLDGNKRMTELQNKLVELELRYRIAKSNGKNTVRVEKELSTLRKRIDGDWFNDILKYGFHTSMGTELMMKEFDTVSGLQNSIDWGLEKLLEDEKGNPNDIHKYIVKWMKLGGSVGDLFVLAGNASRVKGTSVGTELQGIGDRLNSIRDNEDAKAYISQLIAAPNSELVRQGTRATVGLDLLGKGILYMDKVVQEFEQESGIKFNGGINLFFKQVRDKIGDNKYNKIKEDKALLANNTFFDYRINMPEKVDILSRYGVLMFPSFWMRAQRVIYNIAKYHPVNTGVGLAMTSLVGDTGMTIMSSNVINKIAQGTLVNPTGYDVLQPSTLIPKPILDAVTSPF